MDDIALSSKNKFITTVMLFITAVSRACDLISLTFHNIAASASTHASIAQLCNSKHWPTVVS